MYVACSTLCFGQQSLTDALRSMGEMGFTRADVAFCESGPHIKPSEVGADPSKAAIALKSSPGVTPAAFHVEFAVDCPPADRDQQFRSVCRLARVMAVPVVSIPAANIETPIETEVGRLTHLVRIAESEGVTCTVETRIGTFTEMPQSALELCRRVLGLGITLDPSHFVAGPFHSQEFDELYPYVKHVRLRDTGKTLEKFQVRVGQGEIEYGKIVNQLTRFRYKRSLTVDIRDLPEANYPMQPEVRKLKFLLESMI